MVQEMVRGAHPTGWGALFDVPGQPIFEHTLFNEVGISLIASLIALTELFTLVQLSI